MPRYIYYLWMTYTNQMKSPNVLILMMMWKWLRMSTQKRMNLRTMSTHLRIDSPEEPYNDNDDPSKSPLAIGSACSRSDFENDNTPVDSTSPSTHRMTISCVYSTSSTITTNHAMMMIKKMKRILLKESLVRQHSNNRLCYLLRNRSRWWNVEKQ